MDSSNPHPGDQDSTRPDPADGPAGGPVQGNEPAQDPAGPGSAPRDGGQFWPPGRWRRPARVAVGLGVAAAVVAGGVTAAVAAAGSPAPAAARTLAAAAGPIDADTAQLLTVLGLAGLPGIALAGPGVGLVPARPGPLVAVQCEVRLRPARPQGLVQRVIRNRAARVCAGLQTARPVAMYGQLSFRAKDGGTETAAFERGVIQSVSGDSVVVKAADGQTQTWQLTSDSQIRAAAMFGSAVPRRAEVRLGQATGRRAEIVVRPAGVSLGAAVPGRPASRSDLTPGRSVLVVGTIGNGTRTIRLAIIAQPGLKPPASVTQTPSPAPSASGS